jgi:UMF2 family putative MFS family transporter
VLLLLCGLLLLTLAIAVLNTLVPLWLAHENMPTWQVGMVGSSYFTGNLLGTLLTGRVIQRLGLTAVITLHPSSLRLAAQGWG